jgi:hypothetical protein
MIPRVYPSLYDTPSTTLIAVGIGIAIVLLIQLIVGRIHQTAKTDHAYLTRFVTTLVSLVVGVYIADLLIAGPDTSLLSDSEHDTILNFIKDTCLMVFSYYFGLKAQTPVEPAGGGSGSDNAGGGGGIATTDNGGPTSEG